ncbi:MAG TPA: CPBP family intramembrane glutamic endopeptidase [Gemmatimonadales bacterium]
MTAAAPVRGRVGKGAAIGWSVAFFVVAYILAALFGVLGGTVLLGSLEAVPEWSRGGSASAILTGGLAALAAAGAATWLIGARRLRLGPAELRYEGGRRGIRGLALGLVIGGLAAGAALLLGVAIGSADWVREAGGAAAYAREAAKTFAVLAPAALAEEVLFRGVPLVILAAAFGRAGAVIGLALLFGLAHLANPGITPLAVANIAAAGIFLSLAFFAPGGILTAFGAHLGWNATIAALDAPVSGLPFAIPAIDYVAGGPAWLTGGDFGPEGGLSATTAIGLASLAVARWIRKERSA